MPPATQGARGLLRAHRDPSNVNGRALSVVQFAGLAAPGHACVLSISTDDAGRGAGVVRTVRDSFRVPPA